MKVLYRIFLILLVVWWLNRGLYAWLDLNLVSFVFPDVTTTTVDTEWVETTLTSINIIAKAVYSAVALWAIRVLLANFTKKCSK